MVQVSQERMMQIRKALNNMEDCRIDCGPVGADRPDETVYIRWIENDQSVNAGYVDQSCVVSVIMFSNKKRSLFVLRNPSQN
jgi:hypothetical protein